MSTPSRTPHRLYIPAIDTSSARRVKHDFHPYGGWETPHSAQDRRRPSLTHSMLSEPSPTSLPSTPGYNTAHSSFSSVYMPSGITTPMRAMNYMKPDAEAAKSIHDLSYEIMMAEDKYQPAMLDSGNDKYQPAVLMSPIDDVLVGSFASAAGSGPWDHMSQAPIQMNPQYASFRSSAGLQRTDSFASIDPMARSMAESMVSQMPAAMPPCSTGTNFEGMQTQSFLSPHQLVIPDEIPQHDVYGYIHSGGSGMTTPIEQAQLHSASFDSFSSMSPWSQMDASSPINEYALPGQDLVGNSGLLLKDDSTMSTMLGHSDFDQQTPVTPRRSRIRGKPSSSKRCRTMTHQLAHNYYGVEVAIDSKSLKVDNHGRITKKGDGSEPKRFKCSHDGCESRSARKEHLRRHELSHQKEKQFHCNLPKCFRAITRSDNLIQHLMTHVRPPKPGKRNNHHSPKRVERMVLETMKDSKLAERTITNLRKAIEREQDRWPQGLDCDDEDDDMDWNPEDVKAGAINDDDIENLKYEN